MLASKTQKLATLGSSTLGTIALLGFAPAAADVLVTNDGRILQVERARETEDGYRLEFQSGVIECPAEFVASVEMEGNMDDYVPQNDNEREKLEDGFVRFEGRWISRVGYERELAKRAKAAAERTAYLAEHSRWENAWEEETRHFIIRTNTSEELLEYYGELMEAWYDKLDDRVGINPPPSLRRKKMTVNIFKSREEFHELNAAGVGGGVAGYFSFLEESLNFYHDFQEPAISDWVALHEGTHLLTYLIEPQGWPQIWINEGIADYLGSAEITRDRRGRIEIEPGRIQTDRILTVQNAIAEDTFVGLERLFTITKSEFQAFEYAHAWSFVYFLNNSSREYQRGFDKFFKDIYTLPRGIEFTYESFPNKEGTAKIAPPEEVRRVLLRRLGVDDVQALEDEWREFIASVEIDTPQALFKRAFRTVSRGGGDREQAGEDLDRAIQGGVTDPRAYWARARLRSIGRNRNGALEDYRRAIEMAPLNASFRYDLARFLSGRAIFFFGGADIQISGFNRSDREFEGDEEELAEARSSYGLATELDPENDGYRRAYEEFLEAVESAEE